MLPPICTTLVSLIAVLPSSPSASATIQNGQGGSDQALSSGPNLIANGDFSSGNVGFVSDLKYTPPAYNCLWPQGYTLAKVWNKPLLHRLFASEQYTSPEGSPSHAKVMFANAGGTDTMVMWKTTVPCEPNTRYQISFKAISLNGERKWVPTYEIQVNGTPSPAQEAGFGGYLPIAMTWNAGEAQTATVSIVRLPMSHMGGLVGLAAVKMVKLR